MTRRIISEAVWEAHRLAYGRDIKRQPHPVQQQVTANAELIAHPLIALCADARLPIPVPEFVFHPVRKWRFDYAWPEHKVALEVDGGIWRGHGKGSTNTKAGAHSHPTAILRDMEKGNAAVLLGWRVLRFVPEELHHALPALQELLA